MGFRNRSKNHAGGRSRHSASSLSNRRPSSRICAEMTNDSMLDVHMELHFLTAQCTLVIEAVAQ